MSSPIERLLSEVLSLSSDITIEEVQEKLSAYNEETVQKLRGLLRTLSDALPKPNRNGSGSSRDKALAIDCIIPEEAMQAEIGKWVSCPESFFEISTEDHRISRLTLQSLYRRISGKETRRGISDIHRRFELLSLYTTAVQKGYHNGQQWRPYANKKLAQEIVGSGCDIETTTEAKMRKICENLKKYVELGRGFSEWVELLGHSSYLILLPTTLSENFYAERHDRKDIVKISEHFRSIGIESLAKDLHINSLGDYIVQKLIVEYQVPVLPPSNKNSEKRRLNRFKQRTRAHRTLTATVPTPENTISTEIWPGSRVADEHSSHPTHNSTFELLAAYGNPVPPQDHTLCPGPPVNSHTTMDGSTGLSSSLHWGLRPMIAADTNTSISTLTNPTEPLISYGNPLHYCEPLSSYGNPLHYYRSLSSYSN